MWLQKWIEDCDSETLARKILTFCQKSGMPAIDDADCDCAAHKIARTEDAVKRAKNAEEREKAATSARVAAEEYAKSVSQDVDSTRHAYEVASDKAAQLRKESLDATTASTMFRRANAELKQEVATWQGRAEVAERDLAAASKTLQRFREILSGLL